VAKRGRSEAVKKRSGEASGQKTNLQKTESPSFQGQTQCRPRPPGSVGLRVPSRCPVASLALAKRMVAAQIRRTQPCCGF
jgi:hypothetical protein